jgi:hypothetical protein
MFKIDGSKDFSSLKWEFLTEMALKEGE